MICTDEEYNEAKRKLENGMQRLDEHKTRLEARGLAADEVELALDPMRSFHEQFRGEIEYYERLRNGDVDLLSAGISSLSGFGAALVGMRIACGLTQGDLARRLGVEESQVSRDEFNEYHGITMERALKIVGACGVRLAINVELPSPPTDQDLVGERRTAARGQQACGSRERFDV